MLESRLLESRVVRKLTLRLLPVLVLGYFLAIIDRIAVTSAARSSDPG